MEFEKLEGNTRENIHVGDEVEIVQKHHQRTEKLTRGIIEKILTKSPNHPDGIEVILDTGEVGRVRHVISKS